MAHSHTFSSSSYICTYVLGTAQTSEISFHKDHAHALCAGGFAVCNTHTHTIHTCTQHTCTQTLQPHAYMLFGPPHQPAPPISKCNFHKTNLHRNCMHCPCCPGGSMKAAWVTPRVRRVLCVHVSCTFYVCLVPAFSCRGSFRSRFPKRYGNCRGPKLTKDLYLIRLSNSVRPKQESRQFVFAD